MASPFWSEGLRFECQGGGCCCRARGDYGYVFLSIEDRRRLAGFLGMKTAAFTRRYCDRDDEEVFLKDAGRDCMFLGDSGCRVYEARPTQCRTWPFWPENMKKQRWERDVASFCPGVGKGRLYSGSEIAAFMRLHRSKVGKRG